MPTLFTVTEAELKQLAPEQAVEFFGDLLYLEARKLGIPIRDINISLWVNVPDGGIDARVKSAILNQSDLIISGRTGYQIKTGSSFKPWQDGQIRKTLFGKKAPTKENLCIGIKSCLEENGSYTLVCFKYNLVDAQQEQAVKGFEYYLKQCGYENPKVKIWSLNNLMSFQKPFPSLALKLKRLDDLFFQSYKSWSDNGEMKRDFVKSKDFDKKKEILQEVLRSYDSAKHIRIIDKAGIGKTRFVLEALNAKDIQTLVIYTKADAFMDSNTGLLSLLLRDGSELNVIMVIDECSQQQSRRLWDLLQNCGPRIKLITIYNKKEISDDGIDYFIIPHLLIEDIKKIISNYKIPKEHLDHWARFVEDSPRFAHMIGNNLERYPDDITRPAGDIYDRIIAGYDDPCSIESVRRKRVLMHLALFERFGYEGSIEKEARIIARIIEKTDRDITWGIFREIICDLKSLQILQGENTLYITPDIFHIHMFREWWNTYGSRSSFDELLNDISNEPQLKEWFYEMMKYAHLSPRALEVVKEIYGEAGLLQT